MLKQNYGGYIGGYFFNPILRNISMIKGDTMAFGFQVQGLKGETPSAVQFTCKKTLEDSEPLFAVSLGDTIDLRSYDADTDVLTYGVRIPPRLTADIDAGRYYYDLELQVNSDVITLMIGRISVEDQVTTSLIPPEPSYENGDNIAYPTDDEPTEEDVKLYGELKIYNIAEGIQDITGSSEKMTTAQMITALGGVKDDLDDIETALRSVTGASEDIPLDEIADEIGSLINMDTLIEKNINALTRQDNNSESLSGIVYYPADNRFYIIYCTAPIKVGFKFDGDHDNGLSVSSISYVGVGGNLHAVSNLASQTSGVSVEGIQYPNLEVNRDASTTGDLGIDISTLETSSHPLLSSPSRIYNLFYISSHPLAKEAWGNEKKKILADIINNVDILKVLRITSVPSNFNINNIARGIVVRNGNVIVVDAGAEDSARIEVDSSNNIKVVAGTSHYWSYNDAFFRTTYYDDVSLQMYLNNGSGIDYVGGQAASNILFSTYDVLDPNGDVYYPANITIEKFKRLFHLS